MTLHSIAEPIAVAATVASVWGASREASWSWVAGLIGTAGYAVICATLHLWGSLGLQGLFALQCLHGFWMWSRHRARPIGVGAEEPALATAFRPTRQLARQDWVMGGAMLVGYVLLLLSEPHLLAHDAPWWRLDWALAATSLWSTWLLAYKRVASWAGWLVTNVGYVVLWSVSGVPLSALLYAGLSVFAVVTWRRWWRLDHATASATQDGPARAAVAPATDHTP